MLTKYHQQYLIQTLTGQVVGTKVQTRGDDINFPTFELEDGTLYGTHHEYVLGKVTVENDE